LYRNTEGRGECAKKQGGIDVITAMVKGTFEGINIAQSRGESERLDTTQTMQSMLTDILLQAQQDYNPAIFYFISLITLLRLLLHLQLELEVSKGYSKKSLIPAGIPPYCISSSAKSSPVSHMIIFQTHKENLLEDNFYNY
jgi:hypothetical protein